MDERWLPVPGYEGAYEVSDFGRVRSLPRKVKRGSHVTSVAASVLTTTPDRHGYLHVRLSLQGRTRTVKAHRLVLLAFVGQPPAGCGGLHDNGDPSDNRLVNLYWGSQTDNQNDTVRHGRHGMAKREQCPRRHPLVAPNLRAQFSARGHRSCRACHRAQSAIAYAKESGLPLPDLQELSDIKFAEIMNGAAA